MSFYLFEVFFVLLSKFYFGDQYNCWTVADLRYLFADALKPGAEYPPRLFSGQSFTPWTLKMESSAKVKAKTLETIRYVTLLTFFPLLGFWLLLLLQNHYRLKFLAKPLGLALFPQKKSQTCTVFENRPKCRIQHCERSKLR